MNAFENKKILVFLVLTILSGFAHSDDQQGRDNLESYEKRKKVLNEADELIASLKANQKAILSEYASAMAAHGNKGLPLKIDSHKTLIREYSVGPSVISVFEIYHENKPDEETISDELLFKDVEKAIKVNYACSKESLVSMFKMGIILTSVYALRSGEIIYEFSISKSDCDKN